MTTPTLSDADFERVRRFAQDRAGISLTLAKKAMVAGRLARRLQALGLVRPADYLDRLEADVDGEAQQALDLLTTNETYFFREARHFELLAQQARSAPRGQPFRVWSAACSSGEEVYGLAMVLADTLGEQAPWEVVGSDISQRVLQRARQGHYPMSRIDNLPPEYLKRYCLKGTGPQEGTLLVTRSLRQRVRFVHLNLNDALPALGEFDAVFLRAVMIYFDLPTKRAVVQRVLQPLRPGALFFVGHSETLNDVSSAVLPVAPAAYRKPGQPRAAAPAAGMRGVAA